MTYKITLTGPESTGKSTLAEALSVHYQTPYVSDFSRIYIHQLNKPYTQNDVLEIARGIIQQEDELIKNVSPILISDNDLINIKIWLQFYKWKVPEWLLVAIGRRKSDLYLLCNINLPWVADTQRDRSKEREFLYNRFLYELKAINANYKIISETANDQRLKKTISQIEYFLQLRGLR